MLHCLKIGISPRLIEGKCWGNAALQHTIHFSSTGRERGGGGGVVVVVVGGGCRGGRLGLGHVVGYNKKFDFHSLFHAIGSAETPCPMGVS